MRKGDDPATYPARAIAALERARGEGTDLGLDLVLGRLYVQTKSFAKAVPLLSRVVESQPSLVDAAILLSTAQEGAGQPEQAIDTLQKVLAENAGSFRAQMRLAEIYEEDEQWNEAANALARAQTLNPRAPMIARRRAVALLSAGRASESRDLLQATIASGRPDAKDPILLYLLAESQRVVKDLDAAQATAQALIAANPEDVRGLHVLSLILQDKGDIKGAERALRDLIARDPMDANALNSLGYMLAERRDRLDEAVSLLQRALKIEPGNPSYLDSLGWAYFQQGRLDLADAPLTEAADKLQRQFGRAGSPGRSALQAAPLRRCRGGVGAGPRRGRPVDRQERKSRARSARLEAACEAQESPASGRPVPRHRLLRTPARHAAVRGRESLCRLREHLRGGDRTVPQRADHGRCALDLREGRQPSAARQAGRGFRVPGTSPARVSSPRTADLYLRRRRRAGDARAAA